MDNNMLKREKISQINSMLKRADDYVLDEVISLLRFYDAKMVSDTDCEDLFYIELKEIIDINSPNAVRLLNALKWAEKTRICDLFDKENDGTKYGISIADLFSIRGVGIETLDLLIGELLSSGIDEGKFMLSSVNTSKVQKNDTIRNYLSSTKHDFIRNMAY